MRNIFDCLNQVTSEILSLELGLLPVRHIIKLRRLIYFQHILKQRSTNSLIFQFLKAQEQHPKSNDWFTQVSKDLTDLEIQMNHVEIECMSSSAFKTLCKIKIKQIAFQYLEDRKKAHKLVKHIQYEKFETATYLKEGVPKLSVQEGQYIFQCRVKYIDLRAHRSWK